MMRTLDYVLSGWEERNALFCRCREGGTGGMIKVEEFKATTTQLSNLSRNALKSNE